MSDIADRHKAAMHEAGHAVAATLLDRPVREVAVVGSSGRCALGVVRTWSAWDAVDEAIIALCGPMAGERAGVPAAIEVPVVARAEEVAEMAAEAIWRNPYADVPLDDETAAERLIASVALSADEAQALLRVAEIRAEAMVDDASFWAAVLHVADLLHRHGHLDGDAVRVEVERVTRRLEWAAEHANEGGGHGPEQDAA